MEITDHRYSDIEGQEGLIIEDGDFSLVESEQDHIKDIVFTNKGEYKQDGLVGVGALDFLNGTADIDDIKKRISLQLEYDNFKVTKISRDPNGQIRIIARRNEAA